MPKKNTPIKKLVRDNIPDIIKKDGKKPNFRILKENEYIDKLFDKLQEEYQELLATTTEEEILEEITDLIEVCYSLGKAVGVNPWDLNQRRIEKNIIKGSFNKKIYLTSITEK